MSIIPALMKVRQESSEFQAILGYIVRPCLKTKTKQKILKQGQGHGSSGRVPQL
jgi:hypothetical protein